MLFSFSVGTPLLLVPHSGTRIPSAVPFSSVPSPVTCDPLRPLQRGGTSLVGRGHEEESRDLHPNPARRLRNTPPRTPKLPAGRQERGLRYAVWDGDDDDCHDAGSTRLGGVLFQGEKAQ